jgi:hypothetical protein
MAAVQFPGRLRRLRRRTDAGLRQRADGQKANGQKANGQKANGQKANGQKANGQRLTATTYDKRATRDGRRATSHQDSSE